MRNGLRLDAINTKAIDGDIYPLLESKELRDFICQVFGQEGYLVAYLDNKVCIGRFYYKDFYLWEEEDIDPKYLQRLRVFNDEGEILIWRACPNRFRYRCRWDGEGNVSYIIKASQTLWGTKSQNLDSGWVKLYEDRGMEIILPFDQLILAKNKKDRVSIETINYIGSNALGQAGYIDSRFVGFSRGGKEIG